MFGPTVNLSGVNLSDQDINGVNLEGAHLINANVTNCKIECNGIPASLPNGCAMCPVLTQQGNGTPFVLPNSRPGNGFVRS